MDQTSPKIIDHQSSIIDFDPTTRVVFGFGTLEKLGALARELGCKRALIVSDAGIVAAGHVKKAEEFLHAASVTAAVFDGVAENPTTRHVENGVVFAKDFKPDVIIGLGGGSSMDCAKGINFILTNGGKMEDYWGVGKATKPMLPSIGIPTTAGTGSEAQSFALIVQEGTHRKMACGDVKARFSTVILDPQLVRSAPSDVMAVTGMDAISHAVESYVSTKRNPISQMFGKEAWRLLAANYPRVLSAPDDTKALGKMLLGAHFAGTAIETSMLGAAHACANPLTARFGVTHGIAVGLMLPHVVRFNGETVNGHYDELLAPLSLVRKPGSNSASQLAARLVEFMRENNWPFRLRDLKIGESDLPDLAQEAAQQWTGKFNPRQVGERELLFLYEKAF